MHHAGRLRNLQFLDMNETAQIKICPRCTQSFACNAGNIAICQCTTVSLTADERAYISKRYTDCLCARCLRELAAESKHPST